MNQAQSVYQARPVFSSVQPIDAVLKGNSQDSRRNLKKLDELGMARHWVLINKVAEYTGYSDDAIRAKKHRGEWKEGIHWRKGPDGRLVFNLVAIQNWMGGCDA